MQGKLRGTVGGMWVIDCLGMIYVVKRIYTNPRCDSMCRVRNIQSAKVGDNYHFYAADAKFTINNQDIPLLFEMTHGKVSA